MTLWYIKDHEHLREPRTVVEVQKGIIGHERSLTRIASEPHLGKKPKLGPKCAAQIFCRKDVENQATRRGSGMGEDHVHG
uniref:Uncharacterized protein n=1 Tax=Bursaphelenchus xylophilus TaxID=6326 RepID=A0A1I7RHR7_BURXY